MQVKIRFRNCVGRRRIRRDGAQSTEVGKNVVRPAEVEEHVA